MNSSREQNIREQIRDIYWDIQFEALGTDIENDNERKFSELTAELEAMIATEGEDVAEMIAEELGGWPIPYFISYLDLMEKHLFG